MKKYILIKKSMEGEPDIVRTPDGNLQWFPSKTEAKRFTMEQKITDYEIFKLEQRQKPD